MKNLLILGMVATLAACASNNEEVYKGYDNQGCNYYDAKGNCVSPRYQTQSQQAPVKVIRPRNYTYETQPTAVEVRQTTANTPLVATSPCNTHSGAIFGPAGCSAAPVQQVATQPVPEPQPVVQVQPAKKYVYVQAPCMNGCAQAVSPCNGCAPVVREVREPVEVTYKKTRYTTVYQPQTYQSVSYEKQQIAQVQQVQVQQVQVSEPVVVAQPVDVVPAVATQAVTAPSGELLVATTPSVVTESQITMPEYEIK